MTSKDPLGDKLKEQEQAEAGRKLDPAKPFMARLDGRAFSNFTRGLGRPYDPRMSKLMFDTAGYLLQETHAMVAYTQSDEITLSFAPAAENSTHLFDGKIQKLVSTFAALATSYFTKHLDVLPEKMGQYPTFDCRVWNVESLQEVYENYQWRQEDAIRNSISMAAQAQFSHRKLHGVGSEEKKKMLRDIGYAWEDNPEFFKSGSFLKRVTQLRNLTKEELDKIPEMYRPTEPVYRSQIVDLQLGPLTDYKDPANKLFGKGDE